VCLSEDVIWVEANDDTTDVVFATFV